MDLTNRVLIPAETEGDDIIWKHRLKFHFPTLLCYRPYCRCGWKGIPRFLISNAVEAYYTHLREEGIEL